MSGKHARLPVMMLVIVIAISISIADASTGRRRGTAPVNPAPGTPTVESFTPAQMEAYLSPEQIQWIRPGLKIKVVSATIPSNGKPVVEVAITDDFDQPIDRLGKTTPGVVSISFIFGEFNPETRRYDSHTVRTVTTPADSPRPGVTAVQASADSGGTWTDLETGRARYVFRTAIPATCDHSKTHTIGIYASRNMTDILGKSYYANLEYDFRPDGEAVVQKWDKVRDASSCLNCHDPLAMHGGSRRDVKLCVMCHSPQTSDPDTGESVDMAVMTHKIHRGANLPSVKAGKPYIIIGNRQSVHDYSNIHLPQDIRNCENCHSGTNSSNKPTQSDVWFTKPSRAVCGSCHDHVNFATGQNHSSRGIVQEDDSKCATCHVPDSGQEFDISVKGAHTIPEKSKQLKGINAKIVNVADFAAGKKPTVTFKVTNGDGSAIDGSKLSTFAPMIAGATTNYTKFYRESAVGKGVFDATAGTTAYTFNAAIPADATGTWAITADVYRNVTLKRANGEDMPAIREAAMNPVLYAPVTDSPAKPRRVVVTMAQCNKCHDSLALHGGQRKSIDECVMCHNPVKGDEDRRPANAGAAESVSMQRMIHRIHTGAELTQEYTVYGYGGNKYNFNEIHYPGDRRNCASCHVSGTERLPVAQGAGNVKTLRDYFPMQGPGTAACLGCHDSSDAAAHAYLNTTTFPGRTEPNEACAACHGTGSEWAVEKVHAR